MTIYDLLTDFENLKPERKKSALYRIMDLMVEESEDIQGDAFDCFWDFLRDLSDMEADDYFGTEGANV